MRIRIRVLASKQRLKTSKKCSNRLIGTGIPYILASHLQVDADPDPVFDFHVDPDPV
jgi:hypothetical protein